VLKNAALAGWKRIHPDKPDPKAAKEAGEAKETGDAPERAAESA
jgi:hypothetical protein